MVSRLISTNNWLANYLCRIWLAVPDGVFGEGGSPYSCSVGGVVDLLAARLVGPSFALLCGHILFSDRNVSFGNFHYLKYSHLVHGRFSP